MGRLGEVAQSVEHTAENRGVSRGGTHGSPASPLLVAPCTKTSRLASQPAKPASGRKGRLMQERGTLGRLGEVAQSVEHTAENRGVAGSIPALAILTGRLSGARRETSGPRSARRERLFWP
jgi:hypothetical protein